MTIWAIPGDPPDYEIGDPALEGCVRFEGDVPKPIVFGDGALRDGGCDALEVEYDGWVDALFNEGD